MPTEPIVAEWKTFLDGRKRKHEIHVVSEARDGAALRQGFALAQHPLLFYTRCHPDYRPEDLGKLLDRQFTPEPDSDEKPGPEIDHVHLMSAYRGGVPMPIALRATGWLWRIFNRIVFSYSPAPLPGWLGWRRCFGWFLARTFFGVRYHDVTCPFRLFRRDILARIPIQSDGPFAHVELLAKANFLGFILSEEQAINVKPGPYRGDFREMWKEARRLFEHPDFGPPVLPAPAEVK